MKHQKLLLLFGITISSVIIASLLNKSHVPQTTIEKKILFPDLANRVNDVANIKITSSADREIILQKMENGQWILKSADDYPAQFNKVKEVVVGLSQLKILATKTNNPARYHDLGVGGLDVEGTIHNSSSSLLILSDQTDATLASLIIGKPRKNRGGNHRPNFYVRQTDAKNALLVEGYLQLKANHYDWFERNVIHISASRIQGVHIAKSTGAQLTIKKLAAGDTEFKVLAGNTTSPTVLLNKLGTFFENMSVEGVQAAHNFKFPVDATITTFTTFSGLTIAVKHSLDDGKAFAHFSFTAVAPSNPTKETSEDSSDTIDAVEESQRMEQSLSHWVYEIPEFKSEVLDVSVDLTTADQATGDQITVDPVHK